MNISAHLGALKIVTKITIFKNHLNENCSENGNHVLCYCMLQPWPPCWTAETWETCCTTCWNVLESLRQCGGTEIRDGNPVQKVCVSRLEAILFPYTSAQTTAGQSLKTWAYGGCIDRSMNDFDKPEWPTTASLQGEVCKFCPTTSATSPPNASEKLMIDFQQLSPSLSISVQTN